MRNLTTDLASGNLKTNQEYVSNLECLDYEIPTNRGLQDLLSNECFNKLVELNVGSFTIDTNDLSQLKSIRYVGIRLKALTIRLLDTSIKEGSLINIWAKFLTTHTAFRNLQKLDLGRAGITDSAIQVLTSDSACLELKHLYLPFTKITNKAIMMLAKSSFAKRLETLDVSHTHVMISNCKNYFHYFRELRSLKFFFTSLNKSMKLGECLKKLNKMSYLKQVGLSAFFFEDSKEEINQFLEILNNRGYFKIWIEPSLNVSLQTYIHEIASKFLNGVFVYRINSNKAK